MCWSLGEVTECRSHGRWCAQEERLFERLSDRVCVSVLPGSQGAGPAVVAQLGSTVRRRVGCAAVRSVGRCWSPSAEQRRCWPQRRSVAQKHTTATASKVGHDSGGHGRFQSERGVGQTPPLTQGFDVRGCACSDQLWLEGRLFKKRESLTLRVKGASPFYVFES